MTTTWPERAVLADAAKVLAAHRALRPVLDRFTDTPLDQRAADDLRAWLETSFPSAAAALDRLRASDAAAPPPRDHEGRLRALRAVATRSTRSHP